MVGGKANEVESWCGRGVMDGESSRDTRSSSLGTYLPSMHVRNAYGREASAAAEIPWREPTSKIPSACSPEKVQKRLY